jgi:hypothetical protein
LAAKGKVNPKKVVYLWGAGATQGEAQNLGATISLLMRDTEQFGEGVTTRILKRAGRSVLSSFAMGQSGDIEKLISLLVLSGTSEHAALAEKMRTLYFEELRASLTAIGLLENPQLAIQLLELHNDRKFEGEVETLSGVISTNHDGLLQIAAQAVFGAVNLGVSYVSEDFAPSALTPLIVQLHGSFTWQFGVPMQISPLRRNTKYSSNTVWIPPTTVKEAKIHPFNKLSGYAYELLAEHCDVLRVVGASLTQNDWNVLCLIFNAQRHREFVEGSPFRIELIMPQDAGQRIAAECAYLKHLTPIGFLTEGRFSDYKDQEIPPESDLANPFAYWLNQKIDFHRGRGELDGHEARSVAPEFAGATT